jgi:signal peptidase II
LPLLVVVLLTLIIDQSSKAIIKYMLAEGQSIPILPFVFHLTYIRNPGAAFGLFADQTIFFIIATLFVITLVMVVARRIPESRWLLKLSLGLILGGAVGNLLDRLRYGLVVDFLDFRVWPVFNLADSAIVLGACLLVLEVWRGGQDAA